MNYFNKLAADVAMAEENSQKIGVDVVVDGAIVRNEFIPYDVVVYYDVLEFTQIEKRERGRVMIDAEKMIIDYNEAVRLYEVKSDWGCIYVQL